MAAVVRRNDVEHLIALQVHRRTRGNGVVLIGIGLFRAGGEEVAEEAEVAGASYEEFLSRRQLTGKLKPGKFLVVDADRVETAPCLPFQRDGDRAVMDRFIVHGKISVHRGAQRVPDAIVVRVAAQTVPRVLKVPRGEIEHLVAVQRAELDAAVALDEPALLGRIAAALRLIGGEHGGPLRVRKDLPGLRQRSAPFAGRASRRGPDIVRGEPPVIRFIARKGKADAVIELHGKQKQAVLAVAGLAVQNTPDIGRALAALIGGICAEVQLIIRLCDRVIAQRAARAQHDNRLFDRLRLRRQRRRRQQRDEHDCAEQTAQDPFFHVVSSSL